MDDKLSQQLIIHSNEITIPEYCLIHSAENFRRGKSVWIKDAITEECHTHADFPSEVAKVSSFFYKRGMNKGDTVIYMTYDLVHIHVIMCGVWRANGIMRAAYPEEDAETIKERIIESSSKWILCEASHVEMLVGIKKFLNYNLEIIVVGGAADCIALSDIFQDDGAALPLLEITKDDPALILCTSGTTGKSKGAVYTHSSFLHALKTFTENIPLVEDHPNLGLVKGTHIGGAIAAFTGLLTGKMILVISILNKENLFLAVHKFKPGFIYGFPTHIQLLIIDRAAADLDLTCVKTVVTGGTIITPVIMKTFERFPNLESCLNSYGMTESCLIATTMDPATNTVFSNTPPFSVGKVVPRAEVVVRDLNTGKILNQHERGEICVKASHNYDFYLNNPDRTAESFQEGFFRTGDLGYFDENNFLFMVERVKELIKYGANHIAPSEIEEIISQHEGIREVCVFGVKDPEGNDMIPRAVVTLKSSGTTAEDILEFANSRLASYKRLRGGVFIVDVLPKGKTGKIARNLVAAMSHE